MTQLTPSLSRDIQAAYAENINKYNQSLSEVLKTGFGMSDNEIFDTLSENEKVSHLFCNQEIKAVFRAQTNQ